MFRLALAAAGVILAVPFRACKFREFTEGVAFFAHTLVLEFLLLARTTILASRISVCNLGTIPVV
jgi:hypothetical protein